MQLTNLIYTPQNKLFQHFLTILGQMVHADLVRQNQYLKVDNEILRSKFPGQVRISMRSSESSDRRLVICPKLMVRLNVSYVLVV